MSRLRRPKYVSIPGTITNGTVNIQSHEKNYVNSKTKLILTWMFDFDFYHIDPIKMTNMVKTPYKSIFGKMYQRKLSWNEASLHCQKLGGYLPFFKDRKDLEKLLVFLKVLNLQPPLGKIFIGLKFYSKKVSCYYVYFSSVQSFSYQ